MFIYPASSWTEGIISSYAPLLAGRLKGFFIFQQLVLYSLLIKAPFTCLRTWAMCRLTSIKN